MGLMSLCWLSLLIHRRLCCPNAQPLGHFLAFSGLGVKLAYTMHTRQDTHKAVLLRPPEWPAAAPGSATHGFLCIFNVLNAFKLTHEFNVHTLISLIFYMSQHSITGGLIHECPDSTRHKSKCSPSGLINMWNREHCIPTAEMRSEITYTVLHYA